MATAYAGDVTKFRLDNFRVTIGGTDIGFTEGGSEIVINSSVVELTADQTGITPLDTRNNGSRVTVKIVFAEAATYATLKKALHDGTLRSSGGTAVGVGGTLSGTRVGLTDAVAIILHPLDKDDSVLTNDINIWKAVADGQTRIKYGPNAKTLYETTFICLPDTSKTAGKQIIDFGLAAAT